MRRTHKKTFMSLLLKERGSTMQFSKKTIGVLAFAGGMLLAAGQVEGQDQSEEPAAGLEDTRQALLDWALSMENAFDLSPRASVAISEVAPEVLQAYLDVLGDSEEEFLHAMERVVTRLNTDMAAGYDDVGAPRRESQGVLGILPGVSPFAPAYPGSVQYNSGVIGVINNIPLLTATNQDRCSGLEDYLVVFYFVQKVLREADSLCVVAGCDPTGVVCAIVCGALELASIALEVAAIPVELCDIHAGNVNSAEIEAAYENSLLIFQGLKCVVAIQDRRNHGCNGEDDDCDGTIDECDEDIFGPLVFIDQSVTKCCYDDAAEAAAAVALAVKAWDDCGNVTVSAPVFSGMGCDKTVQVTATDDCGNATTASTVVTIDGVGPTVTINTDVANVCYNSIDAAEQAVLNAATITDNCDAFEDLEVSVHSSVTECALRVRIEVTDKCGNTTVAAITVRVDPHVPSVDIDVLRLGFRGEVLAFQTPVCYETVAEAEQAVLAVTHAEDNCTVGKELVTSVTSAGNPCSLVVTTKAEDECGNENTDSETVRVDPIDPEVTCSVTVDRLWPANHTMQNVGFTFTATDNCTGEPEIEIFITSDETTASADGAGQASPAPDAFVLRDLDGVFQGILIRAERSSAGNGRVYEITVRATDQCGNVGECSANVSVPPNGNKPAIDSGQYYDATAVN